MGRGAKLDVSGTAHSSLRYLRNTLYEYNNGGLA